MRKGRKIGLNILLILIAIILLGVISLLLFRNSLLLNVLPSLVDSQSDEKITLELDDASVGINGDAYLINPRLGFKDTYLDKARSIKLLGLTFDTIYLYGASYRNALTNGIFMADSLLVISPKVEISKKESGGTEEFHPDNILALLGSEEADVSVLHMKVGKILVDKGQFKIELTEEIGDREQSVDFRVIIENFSTLPEDQHAENKILFSDDIIIEVANIEKFELATYDIDLGSLLFSLRKNKLEIDSIDIFPNVLSDSIDQIALTARKLEFNGLSINEISGEEDIELQSARIFNGSFTSNSNYPLTSGRDAHNNFFSGLLKNFRQFKLDTMGIHEFDVEVLELLDDTIAFVNNINMELYGVLIDSSMMDDIYRKLVFEEFVLNTSALGNYKLPNELRISADSLSYNSTIEEAGLFNIILSGYNTEPTPIYVNIGQLKVCGISEDPLPAPLKMQLSIEIEGIRGNVEPELLSFKNGAQGNPGVNVFEFIQLDALNISNTELQVSDHQIRVASISLINKNLQIRDIAFVPAPPFGKTLAEIGSLSLIGFELERLLMEQALHINEVDLSDMRFSGRLNIPHTENNRKAPANSIQLPFESIYIGRTALNNIVCDNSVRIHESEYSFKSRIDIEIPKIEKEGRSFSKNDLALIKGQIELIDTEVLAAGYELEVDDLFIDLHSGTLSVKGTQLAHIEDGNTSSGILINEFRMPELSIEGFDTRQLIMMEKNVAEDLRSLNFNSLSLKDINARISLQSDTAGKYIEVEDLSLVYRPDDDRRRNFMEIITFSFGLASYLDTNSKTMISIGNGVYDTRKRQLSLYNIQGNEIDHSVDVIGQKSGWEYSSEELVMSGLYAMNTIPTRLGVDRLSLSDASVKIMTDMDSRANASMEFDLEGFRRVGELMTRLSIDTSVFKEVNIHYTSVEGSQSHVFLADSIGLTINNIDIDTSIFDHPKPSVLKRMNIDLKGRSTVTSDSLYEIRSGLISYDFEKNVISIDSFRVRPRYADKEFFEKVGYQTDRMILSSRTISLFDFRLGEFIQDKLIHFGSVDIEGLHLDMARDKTYARKPNDFKPMPQDMLRQLPHKISLDSVRVLSSYVQYGEYVEKSSMPATVFFDRFNLRMYNLSSDLPRPDPTTSLRVELDAYVMGNARFDLSVVFPYVGKLNNFWLNVSSEEIDLTTLNPLTQNALGLSIKDGKGYIENASVNGDSIHTKGTMTFRYKDLKLSMFNRKKAEQNKGLFGAITRFLINDIVIHKNNPRFAREARVGQVYFERDREKAILNYVWKSILSGMLSSIGINTKEQRQERKDMKKINQPN